MTSKHARQSKVKFERNRVSFGDSKFKTESAFECCWSNQGQRPVYCCQAEFRFETCLPDREYLTRYSVSCSKCRPANEPVFHLHCSYCDEILTGSIASPGGKVKDHVVTIRHIVKEAMVQNKYFEQKSEVSCEEFQKACMYVSNLEEWASMIRFKSSSEEKRELDEALRALRGRLEEAGALYDPVHNPEPFSAFVVAPSCSCSQSSSEQPFPSPHRSPHVDLSGASALQRLTDS